MVWRRDATGRISHSLGTLIDQVDARWPNRNRSSDGTIGDAAHAASKSDHNKDSKGIVRALDITHDPVHGVNARAIAQAIVDSRDYRLSYAISNGEMVRSYPKEGTVPWQWSKYTGLNAHTQHCHISVVANDTIADDTRPWALPGAAAAKPKRFTNIYATVFADQTVAYSGIRPGWNDRPGVALPYRIPGTRPRVRLFYGNKSVVADIIDVGPWNVDDPYPLTGARPQAESGVDKRGRKTNLAGIDLTPAAMRALGIPYTLAPPSGGARLDWEFTADVVQPAPPPPAPPPPPSLWSRLWETFSSLFR